jgi:LysM domain
MRIAVQAGDTPGAIAQRFGTMVEDLRRLYGIQDPNRVFAGHTLEMPETPPSRRRFAGPDGGADAAELFTVDQLAEISRNPDPVAFDLAVDQASLIPEMKKGGIVTRNQIAAFLANVCQETDRLVTRKHVSLLLHHAEAQSTPRGDRTWLILPFPSARRGPSRS